MLQGMGLNICCELEIIWKPPAQASGLHIGSCRIAFEPIKIASICTPQCKLLLKTYMRCDLGKTVGRGTSSGLTFLTLYLRIASIKFTAPTRLWV